MSTSFEFLGREARRIKFPRLALFVFIFVFLAFAGLNFFIFTTKNRLQKELSASAARVEADATLAINDARKLIPSDAEIVEIEKLSAQHNLILGGARSSWTRFFNALEAVLPENVVITAIENPKTGKSSFGGDDREFRLRLAVTNIDAANSLYMKFSGEKAFGSLSFTPRGEIKYQGYTGLAIELVFTFNDKI